MSDRASFITEPILGYREKDRKDLLKCLQQHDIECLEVGACVAAELSGGYPDFYVTDLMLLNFIPRSQVNFVVLDECGNTEIGWFSERGVEWGNLDLIKRKEEQELRHNLESAKAEIERLKQESEARGFLIDKLRTKEPA